MSASVSRSLVSQDWLHLWRNTEDRVMPLISAVAERNDLAPLDLKLRVLLHLPRFSVRDLHDNDLVYEEICRLAKKMVELQREFSRWSHVQPASGFDKAAVRVREATGEVAKIIHERFHYLNSNRSGRHFALYCDNEEIPAALATFSEMDVQRLRAYVSATNVKESLLLSRVFAFRWAPRNSISYLLGAAIRKIHLESSVSDFVTWVNPNLGFTASSYRSANWDLCGSEPVKYRYIADNYVSARTAFNDANIKPFQILFSQHDLAALQVWRYSFPR